MSPKFYSFLWVLYFVSASIMWLAGVLTNTTVVAFGFIAFGLIFAGMMCVLPGVVAHPTLKRAKMPAPKKIFQPAPEKQPKAANRFRAYRSA